MDSRFKEWVYIEGLMQSAYHEAALKMNLSDSEFWILYVFNFHQRTAGNQLKKFLPVQRYFSP